MQRNLHNEDFERLLKDKANQYRMYPSEKVWKGIYSNMHTRRRWYGLTILSMLLVSGTLVSLFIFNGNTEPENKVQSKNTPGSAVLSQQNLNRNAEKVQAGSVENILYQTDLNKNILPSANLNSTHENGDEYSEPVLNPDNSLVSEPDQGDIALTEKQNTDPVIQFDQDKTLRIPAPDQDELNKITVRKDELKSPGEKAEMSILHDKISALSSLNAPVVSLKKPSRVTAHVYISPSISYRRLTENKSYPSSQPFGIYSNSNIKNLVDHKPALGLQFGIAGRYRINEQVNFRTGLQFNITRYDIRAYSHPTEIATINLNSGYSRDYVAALSNYRNFNGYTPNWLENFYFQVAIPIGAEYIFSNNKQVNWGVAGTIQPTYVIGDRAYLISSNYANYAKVPNLMRRWNLSTGVETFVTYKTGKVQWQAGPQLRYQHLSSFVYKYPVKENLFDVGLKIAAQISPKK